MDPDNIKYFVSWTINKDHDDKHAYVQVNALNQFQVVFEGPVQSGLSTPRAVDRDRDQSRSVQRLQKTAQNQCRLVLIGFLQS